MTTVEVSVLAVCLVGVFILEKKLGEQRVANCMDGCCYYDYNVRITQHFSMFCHGEVYIVGWRIPSST